MDALLPGKPTAPEQTIPENPITPEDSTKPENPIAPENPKNESDEKWGIDIPPWAYGAAAAGTAVLVGVGATIYRFVSRNRLVAAARENTEIYKQRAIEGMTPRIDNPSPRQETTPKEPTTTKEDFSSLPDTSGKTE